MFALQMYVKTKYYAKQSTIKSVFLRLFFNIQQYSVKFYAASATKLNISFINSIFNVVFGLFSNTSINLCA